jgi:uncharacterized 2Fe-2S/4Fe-4S cluster protein (DUF4445 family)
MNDPVQIELLPLGESLTLERGTPLRDALFAQGVEFPCGGQGRCRGCRVRVLQGFLAPSEDDRRLLSAGDLADGWRLACRAVANGNLKIDLAQWEAAILADNSVFAFTPRDGAGVAVDVGTTTIVAQLLDLRTGRVMAVRTGLNAQARHGADIMSRVEFGAHAGGQALLQQLIRDQIGGLVGELLGAAPSVSGLSDIVLVGNTVMHHLFCGISVEPLCHHPFESANNGLQVFSADALGWSLPGNPRVRFLPCLGSFVGSDILAGILATKLHESRALAALIDLGTNGEIVVGNHEQLLCASTAAGPAFEGARILMGMRAATGAIYEVTVRDARLHCSVLGRVAPRGICGSGLVDAVAAGLTLGRIRSNGRLTQGSSLPLVSPVVLTQDDVRELQLAKGAIAAGLRILARRWGARPEDLSRIYLAGAFGNYINRASARRIGLLDVPNDKAQSAGNTALLGAKLALFSLHDHDCAYPELRQKVRHVSLNEDPHFQEIYVEEMAFPDGPEYLRRASI